MKVIKIGGGCLKNPKTAGRITRLIERLGKGHMVVVSAFFGVTDQLMDGIGDALADERTIPGIIKALKKRHHAFMKTLIPGPSARRRVEEALSERFKKLERLYYGVSFTGEATPRMQDWIASFGERFSGMILAAAIRDLGAAAVCAMPEEAGIATDGRFGNATADMDKTSAALAVLLKKVMNPDTVLIIPGFFGTGPGGEITTFGRGGSDYSAAVAAAAAGAETLEIWKDTEGFMTADPDNIPHARLIAELTYDEAAELAYTGAGILHPRTVEPVKARDIPITIRNTLNPHARGSLISRKAEKSRRIVKSVSYTTDVAILKIYAANAGARHGLLSEVVRRLADRGINLKTVITSQTCIGLLLSEADAGLAETALSGMPAGTFRKLKSRLNVALVSIVGKGLHKNKGLAAKCFTAVSKASVNIEMISFGASDAALYFMVRRSDLDASVNALHDMFFG